MSYVTPGTVAAGDVATAAAWNVITNDVIDTRAVIVNVVSASVTTILTLGTGSQTFFDFTGLSVTITPSSATSKILIFGHATLGADAGGLSYIRILRGATAISVGTGTLGSRSAVHSGGLSPQPDSNALILLPINFLDSPATTSATTYKIQAKTNSSNPLYGNRTAGDVDASYSSRGVSTITVMEVPV